MNILIIGNGGREFTFAWKLSQSPLTEKLFIAPGNAGTEQFGTNVPLAVDDLPAISQFAKKNAIDMVLVGPEVPLVLGLRDHFEKDPALADILFIGPGSAGAQLEGSKDFSKEFMIRHGIPTAQARTFSASDIEAGLQHLESCSYPAVLKADGLAGGKGVVIAQSKEEAKGVLKDMIEERRFGDASKKVLIEEFLDGIELSVFVLTDGQSYIILPEAKDYKRIGDRDTGPNTGGMGAVSPVDFANEKFMKNVENQVIIPTINGLKEDNIDFTGFIFIGLMKVGDIPYVIEYNVRMGDPETQVVIPRIKNDLVEVLSAVGRGKLSDISLEVEEDAAATIVMVSEGYPGDYQKGHAIDGLADVPNALVIHAGTKRDDYKILTDGGRVLSVTGRGKYLEDALKHAYDGVKYISWKGSHYRKDIGKDVLADHID